LERVGNHLFVWVGTDASIEINILEALTQPDEIFSWDFRLTDGEEVWSQAGVDELYDDLDHAAGHYSIDYTPNAVVDVPKGAHTELHDQDEGDGDGDGDDSVGYDRNVLRHLRVGEGRLVDFAELGRGASGGWADGYGKEFASWNRRPHKKAEGKHAFEEED